MGEKRDAYVQKLKENIDKWNTEIDEFQAKSDQAKADAQVQYHKQIDELRTKRNELLKKMTEMSKASEAAWEDVKTGVDVARQVLGESIKSAKTRFN